MFSTVLFSLIDSALNKYIQNSTSKYPRFKSGEPWKLRWLLIIRDSIVIISADDNNLD